MGRLWGLVSLFAGLLFATTALAARPLPVRDVTYEVRVEHALAEVTLTQTFVNDRERFIEGVYTFPLPEAAAVDGMVIEVEGRRIVGRIERRAEARRTYRAAVAQGRVAALTEEYRPNVFTQRVGNVPPEGTIDVELRFVVPVPRRSGVHELVLPLVVAPRFVPDPQGRETGDLEPGPLLGGPPLAAHIDLDVASAFAITEVTSPTHPIPARHVPPRSDDQPHRVTASWSTATDRDVVVRWATVAEAPSVGLLVQDDHLLLTVEAPGSVPVDDIVPREVVWVVDQSASMKGAPMALARQAMLRMLDHLDERDSLWILPSTEWLAVSSGPRPVSPWTRTLARGLVESLDARGPTPLFEGLQQVLQRPVATEAVEARERTIVVVTDGLVANDREVLGNVADRVAGQRIFTIGPGPAPNRFLLTELARLGGGAATFLRAGEEPAAVVDRFVQGLRAPVLTDVTVDWGDWVVIDPTPDRLPAVYADQPLEVAAKIERWGTTPITVRARSAAGPFEATVTPVALAPGRTLPSTWARRTIGALEAAQRWQGGASNRIVDLSVSYQVSSRYTSFVAVDEAVVRDVAEVDAVFRAEQPAAAPAGARFFEDQPIEGQNERSQALTKEFLQSVPAGRSYQNAITIAAGVQPGAGGNELEEEVEALDILGEASVESATRVEYAVSPALVEGKSVSSHLSVMKGVTKLVLPDPSPVWRPPTLVAPAWFGVVHLSEGNPFGSRPLGIHHTAGRVNGSLLYGRVDVEAVSSRTRVRTQRRDLLAHLNTARIDVRSGAVVLDGASYIADISDPRGSIRQTQERASLSMGNPDYDNVRVRATAQVHRVAIGEDLRGRQNGALKLEADVDGAGEHAFDASLVYERTRWRRPDGTRTIGVGRPDETLTRWSAQAGDAYVGPNDRWRGSARIRTDVLVGRPWLAPSLGVGVGVSDDVDVEVGARRTLGHLDLPALLRVSDVGPSKLDEGWGRVRFARDAFAVQLEGAARVHRDVVTTGGDRFDRHVPRAGLRAGWHGRGLRIEVAGTRRWWMNPEDAAPSVVFVDDGRLDAFGWTLQVHGDVLISRWPRFEVSLGGAALLDPLGQVVSGPALTTPPNVPRLRGDLEVRVAPDPSPRFTFLARLSGFRRLDGGPGLEAMLNSGLQDAVLPRRAIDGWRVAGALDIAW